MVYGYRSGHGFREVSAQVVGETIDRMMETRGEITPAEVVEESRPANAPLHPLFEWDDSVAAEKYREDQARAVIRSYVIIVRDDQGNEHQELRNVSIAQPFDHDGPAYVQARRAMEDPGLRARVIALQKSQLDGWVARNAHIEELAAYVDAIRQAKETAEREAAAKKTQKQAPRAGRRERRPQPAMV
jgi:hypothetical protein